MSFYAFKANLDRGRGGWALYYSLLSKDIRSHYFMANRGRKGGSVTDFLFLSSKITADGDGNHEIICLFLGRKAMTNVDSVLKSRDITLLTNVCRVKATVFPVATYICESRAVKKGSAEELMPSNWYWRRVLRIPCCPETARKSNPSILREINSEYSLEGLMLELKLKYSGHLMQTVDPLEKSLMLGKFERRRRRGCQRMRGVHGITNAMDLGKLREMVRDREGWHTAVHGVSKSQT